MWRCVESISAKRCGKWFIPIDEAGGFLGSGALDETAGEEAVLSAQEGQFLPQISPAHLIAKPFLSG